MIPAVVGFVKCSPDKIKILNKNPAQSACTTIQNQSFLLKRTPSRFVQIGLFESLTIAPSRKLPIRKRRNNSTNIEICSSKTLAITIFAPIMIWAAASSNPPMIRSLSTVQKIYTYAQRRQWAGKIRNKADAHGLCHASFLILLTSSDWLTLMCQRISKIILVWAIALFASLVGLDNIVDYASDYKFVSHVMEMDTTFPENRLMWRAIDSPFIQNAAYILIITIEIIVAISSLEWARSSLSIGRDIRHCPHLCEHSRHGWLS